ncbi:DUF2267 domain-containing protein [Streptomyces sp. NPDC008141]|uniref:DUF2267 domain-containing protein n=1 Tax=Streptomyces sp. NPDC008141 TaxID=3364815 RepID=UPI0036E8D77C
MVDTGFSSFDTMVDKANRLLKDIEQANGWPEERRKQSYAALRAVLHGLRDRLPVDGAAHCGAHLPILIRGVYYDGWKPSERPVKFSVEEFSNGCGMTFPYAVDGASNVSCAPCWELLNATSAKASGTTSNPDCRSRIRTAEVAGVRTAVTHELGSRRGPRISGGGLDRRRRRLQSVAVGRTSLP